MGCPQGFLELRLGEKISYALNEQIKSARLHEKCSLRDATTYN